MDLALQRPEWILHRVTRCGGGGFTCGRGQREYVLVAWNLCVVEAEVLHEGAGVLGEPLRCDPLAKAFERFGDPPAPVGQHQRNPLVERQAGQRTV